MKPPDHKRIEPARAYIKKSTLPGTGKGLFTRTPILKGEIIIEYKGIITTFKKIRENGADNPYIYYVNRNHVIDAMPFPGSLARYANDAEGIVVIAGCKNNAKFIVVNKKVFIQALTDILPGAEIFVSYGKDYWDTVIFNLAVKKSYQATGKVKKK
jgi:SET domain-containing protein